MTTQKEVQGVYAAVLAPRHPDDSIDVPGLRSVVKFLLKKGIHSFALNGATGEFCLTTAEQLRTMIQVVREVSGGDGEFLCGVGAAGVRQAIVLSQIAQELNAKGLLLPMPYFFPYQQEDLEAFSRTVAAATDLPILLYNLPQFTSGLEKETVGRLITDVPNILGIKDSSGSLEILRHLTESNLDACRMVGNDSALAPAMEAGVCDGVISGVACVLPEVILSLYAQRDRVGSAEYRQVVQQLNEFIAQLAAFPTPWGLKWIAEARGVVKATFSQPISKQRTEQGQRMMQWFSMWLQSAALPPTSV
ncbi:MAG: dihydrodipicolinate synthase family protein [Acidobacteriaceae bacterium]